MKILQYRTIAAVYPCLSLEAKVCLDNGDIVYTNISVNNRRETVMNTEDSHWTYKKPITEVDWEKVEDFEYVLSAEDDKVVCEELLRLWNANPVFNSGEEWKPYLIEEHLPKMASERTKLTDEEFNAVTKWTMETKFDSVMDITTNDDGDDIWMDYENDEELSLEEGFQTMAEAVAYPFTHEGLTEEEGSLIMNLLEEFGVEEDALEYIRNLKE